ncbi:glycosyl transferase family protein [Escherichia coli]
MDWLLDVFATWLYGLKVIAITLAVIMFISGLDDFFIDVVYWVRRIKRKLSVYRRYPRMSYRELYKPDEKPLAIMVPAWNETGVIGNMAELAATTLDYENYHIFVGTYPNDPDTQRDVDEVCARFPNVHKVVCARPGPTSKADCLNNVLDAITQFERSANFAFAGFILHDAEDVISPMELRLFNYLVERKDLIQIPVYPFEREWTHFTSMTYIDEFSELHGKDVPVREALAGQVPSAGVGTCFSRRAVTALLADGDGIAFDVQSLTEDYDIGFRLKEKGMTEIFVRFPVVDEAKEREQRKFLQHARTSNMICVREYFPDTFSTAVRQKSRWIIGIVFQGFKTHKWTSSLTLNYFLWRDRKGAISNFVSFLAMLVMLQLLLLLAYESLWPNAWHFLSIFSGSAWLMTLLWLNFGLMVNRIVQRVIFVTGYYGLTQGLLSVLRLFWGNLINFMANWRALKQVLQHGDPRRVAWDKTTHDFPSVTGDTRSLRPLGQILLENQVITEEQLDTALRNRVEGLRLGGSMLMQGLMSQLRLQGFDTLVLQWTRYGDAFTQPEQRALLFKRAAAAQQAGLKLIVGLNADPEFFMHQKQSSAALESYLNRLLAADLQQARLWSAAPGVTPDGWYISAEIDDLNWRSEAARQPLLTWLNNAQRLISDVSAKPVYISSFFAGNMSPDGYRQLLEQVKATGVNVWVQDGSGVDKLTAEQRERYLQASADCQSPAPASGIVYELFVAGKGKTFTAKPKPDAEIASLLAKRSSCGKDTLYFSLRYLPVAHGILEY